ncbi:MAG TPA: SCP2 sterol-binding domain-containing protein [Acidimicrobiales bacterium]|nr:SCP2 sterol-binding domain-containing protein [Acidimicrobiales bacterium]
MPDTYPFLSDDWMAAAQKIRDEYAGRLEAGETPEVRLNQIITDVPFCEEAINLHVDSTAGRMSLAAGHLEDAEVTVTLDYDTARAIFLDPVTAVQHFMSGKIKVEGDMTKLMGLMQSPTADPDAADVQKRLAEITQ